MGRKLGLRKKDKEPFYTELDTRIVENWSIILRNLEILGWEKFELFGNEIKIESGCMPMSFIQEFFEGIFDTPFKIHSTKIDNIIILIPTYRTQYSVSE